MDYQGSSLPNIFDPWLVESVDIKPVDMEEMYYSFKINVFEILNSTGKRNV